MMRSPHPKRHARGANLQLVNRFGRATARKCEELGREGTGHLSEEIAFRLDKRHATRNYHCNKLHTVGTALADKSTGLDGRKGHMQRN